MVVQIDGFRHAVILMARGNGASPPEEGEVLEFPCELDIKVFVRAEGDLEQQIHALLLQHLEPEQVLGIRRKVSRKGNYHSLSCQVRANSRNELDRVYRALSGNPDILMVL